MSKSEPLPVVDLLPSQQTAEPADFSRLSRRDGVCGGSICIRDTRVPVWVLERCRQLQMSLPEILEDYPFLDGNDLAAAWRYAEAHRDEIEGEIRANRD